MSKKNLFNRVGGIKPRRNVFDLSYRKNFTCDMGNLIPIMCDEVVPGDTFKIGNQVVIRFQPMAAPVMHEISAHVHYFFVPYRLLWDDWENFISQGFVDPSTGKLPIPLPRRNAANSGTSNEFSILGTLWDYFGFPMRYGMGSSGDFVMAPIDFPWRAYNMVYNEYYRDQDLQEEVDLLSGYVLNRSWKKDYFTSARPFLQKGTPPALPVNVEIDGIDRANLSFGEYADPLYYSYLEGLFPTRQDRPILDNNELPVSAGKVPLFTRGQDIADAIKASSTTFDVSDLRLAFQTQKWLERNARAGTRYTEFLQSHFGVSPSDARLQRPEYIGGTFQPIVVSEVLQTSQTSSDSRLGTMGGHGL
ncbi:MAG: hypothetical protein LBB56_02995, partial [Chitinispirillales bacterium]|nr:hypothetical protein [Chitinispirillales bacterium]